MNFLGNMPSINVSQDIILQDLVQFKNKNELNKNLYLGKTFKAVKCIDNIADNHLDFIYEGEIINKIF
jgi:hypothetical protein